MRGIHSRIIRESPGYRMNLPVSRTDHPISQIRRKMLQIRVFTLFWPILGGHFQITDRFLCVNRLSSIFNSVSRIEKRYRRKIGRLLACVQTSPFPREAKEMATSARSLAVSRISIFLGWHLCTLACLIVACVTV